MEIVLQQKEVINLGKLPSHVTVKCLYGTLWLTCQGSLTDYILKAGDEHSNSSRGKVVMMAMTEVRLCLNDLSAQKEVTPLGSLLHA
jgi:hypothetical protein